MRWWEYILCFVLMFHLPIILTIIVIRQEIQISLYPRRSR
jgi:hypothetical protein